jgi:hypothetical protein
MIRKQYCSQEGSGVTQGTDSEAVQKDIENLSYMGGNMENGIEY